MNKAHLESEDPKGQGAVPTHPDNQPARTDWQKVHHQLQIDQTAIERGWAPTPEEKQNILKTRAENLAREPEAEAKAGVSMEVVQFHLAGEDYAIESLYIREVHPLKGLTPLPCTPPFVSGIVNVRGQILSVIDLKKRFDLPDKGLTDLAEVILLHAEDMEFGLLADAIEGVREIPLDDIQPSLPTLTDVRAAYLRGVTNEQLVILDGAKLLSDERLIVHEEVAG